MYFAFFLLPLDLALDFIKREDFLFVFTGVRIIPLLLPTKASNGDNKDIIVTNDVVARTIPVLDRLS
jgi:hypothetical protein